MSIFSFVQIHYKYWFLFSIKKTFGIFIKFGESFSLGSLLDQSQTYQGNPCGVYPGTSHLYPWKRTTSFKKRSSICVASLVLEHAMKCAILLNLSTTNILSLPP